MFKAVRAGVATNKVTTATTMKAKIIHYLLNVLNRALIKVNPPVSLLLMVCQIRMKLFS